MCVLCDVCKCDFVRGWWVGECKMCVGEKHEKKVVTQRQTTTDKQKIQPQKNRILNKDKWQWLTILLVFHSLIWLIVYKGLNKPQMDERSGHCNHPFWWGQGNE